MSIYEMGPAAHAMERVVVEWMTEKVGWPAGAGGVLTHGGSLANLTVLLAARAAAAPGRLGRRGGRHARRARAAVGSHYSVKRSVAMLGLGERAVVDLEVDEDERIVPGFARRRARPLPTPPAAGRWRSWRRPAPRAPGSTTTWRPIGAFCREHGIWFHVDAAHGASALLSPEHRHLLDGHRARRLRDLGRPQDDAHARARRRGAASRRARGSRRPSGRRPPT